MHLKNKKILISGGAGFVGHHLVEGVLKQTDWDIIILDCLTYAGNLNRLTDMEIWDKEKHRVKFVFHDLKAPISETIHKIIGPIDYVWHLAAESHVGNSLEDALPFAYNVIATTNLLEYLKHYQPTSPSKFLPYLKKYIGFNTDEVFGPAPFGTDYKETDKFYPSNPYSASKAGQWCMEYAFGHAFEMPIMMVHSMNIGFERQHPEKFVPMTIRKILNNEVITIHGIEGEVSTRKWIHAREVCNGLLFLTENGKRGETYNIVGEEKSVLDIANMISNTIRGHRLNEMEIEYIDFHSTRPGHDLRYSLDGSKIKKLGWEPNLSLEESLEKAVRWMIQSENKKWLNL